jgi:hypothetical protein
VSGTLQPERQIGLKRTFIFLGIFIKFSHASWRTGWVRILGGFIRANPPNPRHPRSNIYNL